MANVSLKMTDEQLAFLKQLMHKLSLERSTNLTCSDLIREALEKTYGMKGTESDKTNREK